jgi:hypothetical protein
MGILGLSIIAASFLLMLVIGIMLSNKHDILKGIFCIFGVAGLFMVGVIGFGIAATESVKRTDVIKVECDTVIKTDDKAYVEIDGLTLTYTDKKSYDRVNDSTIFYKVVSYNLYNVEILTEYFIDKQIPINE